MGGLVLFTTNDTGTGGARDIPRERAGRAARLGHGAAARSASSGIGQLARVAHARPAACARA